MRCAMCAASEAPRYAMRAAGAPSAGVSATDVVVATVARAVAGTAVVVVAAPASVGGSAGAVELGGAGLPPVASERVVGGIRLTIGSVRRRPVPDIPQ